MRSRRGTLLGGAKPVIPPVSMFMNIIAWGPQVKRHDSLGLMNSAILTFWCQHAPGCKSRSFKILLPRTRVLGSKQDEVNRFVQMSYSVTLASKQRTYVDGDISIFHDKQDNRNRIQLTLPSSIFRILGHNIYPTCLCFCHCSLWHPASPNSVSLC